MLPIPPGTGWRNVKPLVLPGAELVSAESPRALPSARPPKKKQTIEPRQFGPPSATIEPAPIAKVPKPKPPKRKNDPKLIIAARELRDRWLEQVNATALLGEGKYDVNRAIGERITIEVEPVKLLAA